MKLLRYSSIGESRHATIQTCTNINGSSNINTRINQTGARSKYVEGTKGFNILVAVIIMGLERLGPKVTTTLRALALGDMVWQCTATHFQVFSHQVLSKYSVNDQR